MMVAICLTRKKKVVLTFRMHQARPSHVQRSPGSAGCRLYMGMGQNPIPL